MKDSKTGTVKAVKVGKVKITVTAAKTSDFNAVSKAVTIRVVPAATSAFKADNQAAGIRLTWKKVTGANTYFIFRDNTQIVAIRDGATVTYTDKKATANGAKYVYKVIASASVTGRSTHSASVTAYRMDRPAISSLANSGTGKMTVTKTPKRPAIRSSTVRTRPLRPGTSRRPFRALQQCPKRSPASQRARPITSGSAHSRPWTAPNTSLPGAQSRA